MFHDFDNHLVKLRSSMDIRFITENNVKLSSRGLKQVMEETYQIYPINKQQTKAYR